MTNAFYNSTGEPGTGAFAASAPMRSEFLDIQAAFDKMPLLTAGTAVVVNGAGTALANTVGRLALAGNFTTTGAFNLTAVVGATVTLTMPLVDGTLATLAGTETLSNKTLVAPALGTPVSGVATNLTGLPLTTGVTGTLGVTNGGTGVATFTANGVLYGGGTVGVTAAGTTGQILTGNTGSAPTWAALSGSAVTTISFGTTGLTPSSATAGAIVVAGTLAVANGGTGVTSSTGSGSVVLSTSPALTTPNLGTPSALVLTNATGTPTSIGLANGTGLPISTGVSGLGTGIATFLATPSSANLATAVTDETGSGALVFAASPTLSGTIGGTLTFSGAHTLSAALTYGGVTLTAAVTGTGSMVLSSSPSLTTPTISGALTYGGVTLTAAVTGTGSMVLASSPSLVTPALGVATATSLAIGGATIGTNGLAVTGTASVSGNFTGGANVRAGSASYFFFASSTNLKDVSNGVLGISQSNEAAGISIDVTGSTAKFRNYANAADVGITAGASTFSAALTYGGVTLTNAVTGTGSMALSVSPTFTGSPLAPTQTAGDNSTKLATTAYVDLTRVAGARLTNSLSGDVLLNNTANFFDGPSVAQGTVGTWFASGTVTVLDTSGSALFYAQLWDGTTLINSTAVNSAGTGANSTITLSGYIASPAGNLRISVKDTSTTSGKIAFSSTGLAKDSTISALRIA